MIDIGAGVSLGLGVIIGDVDLEVGVFVTEDALDYLTTEDGQRLREEI